MRIHNTTRGTILADRAQWARGLWVRGRGLMFRRQMLEGEGLVLVGSKSIHTFFMRFPIDVLFVARDGRVLLCHERMPPWRISALVLRSGYVIEVPSGTIRSTGTRAGDCLEFLE